MRKQISLKLVYNIFIIPMLRLAHRNCTAMGDV